MIPPVLIPFRGGLVTTVWMNVEKKADMFRAKLCNSDQWNANLYAGKDIEMEPRLSSFTRARKPAIVPDIAKRLVRSGLYVEANGLSRREGGDFGRRWRDAVAHFPYAILICEMHSAGANCKEATIIFR